MIKVSLFITVLLAKFTFGDISPYNPVPSKEETNEHDSDRSDEQSIKQLLSYDYFDVHSHEYGMLKRLLAAVEKTGEMNEKEMKQFHSEIKSSDMTRLSGSNWHYHQPDSYLSLGRRFVPQYFYTERVINKINEDAEENNLTPKLAPPELVLSVAKESGLLEAAFPPNPTEELINKDILRTGKYWNAVWREDVDPKDGLRTQHHKLQSVHAALSPGTEIYEIVSKLQETHPKLLYVINIKNKK